MQDIQALQKDSVVLGTYESAAFFLSLRDRNEFSSTTNFGYHRIPHIGVYGSDYSLTLPMLLLSLPTTPRYLRKLPNDLLRSVDLWNCVATPTPPPSPLTPPPSHPSPTPKQALTERIISTLHTNQHLAPDHQLRLIARELVNFALSSACSRMRLIKTSAPFSPTHSSHAPDSFSKLMDPRLRLDDEEEIIFMGYRQSKRWSMVSSVDSVDSMEQDDGLIMPPTDPMGRRGSRKVSLMVEPLIIVEEEEEWSEASEVGSGFEMVGGDDDVDEKLQILAKKLVKKVLHLACKKWESMNRRSSIDYLIASTKRMKIASPSPPPTLPENDLYEGGVASLRPKAEPVRRGPSPLPDRSRGKKRNRSQSHDTMMMKELERFRQAQLGLGQEEETTERQFILPVRTTSRGKTSIAGSAHTLQPSEAMGSLISEIRRLSLVEMQTESNANEDCVEEYTILSAVTKPASSDYDTDSQSPVPPPNSPTSLQAVQGGSGPSPSPHHQQSLPPLLPPPPPSPKDIANRLIPEFVISSFDEEQTTCTSPEFQQRLTTPPPSFSEYDMHSSSVVDMSRTAGDCDPAPPDSPVPLMDYYIILHTYPPPGQCQKFLCSNTDEVNMVYHCWLFPEALCDPTIICSQMLSMGVFSPHGVAPVHQNLQDAGIAFHHLQPRTVCIHSCQFSPENAQLQLSSDVSLHTFFSAATDGSRKAAAFHMVPGSSEIEGELREALASCSTVGDLLTQLTHTIPSIAEQLRDLIIPKPS